MERDTTAVVRTDKGVAWWTFAGLLANASLRTDLGAVAREGARRDNLAIALEEVTATAQVTRAIDVLRGTPVTPPPVADKAIYGLKFSRCLPRELARKCLEAQLTDATGHMSTLEERIRFVDVSWGLS